LYLAGTAGLLDLNGTVIVELIAFLIMLGVLAKWVYPLIVQQAEARQKLISEQLETADKERKEAAALLAEAETKLNEARKTAQAMIDGATKSGEQLRQELKQKAEEEAKRLTAAARKEIEAERERAIQSVRNEVAGLVVAATEKVIGETLDDAKHKQLIERAIAEVASGDGSR
jgi:F-type H+-transporting ATPase subunit b